MHSLATIALGAFAIIFFCAALIVGLIILKKYKAEQIRLNELAQKRSEKKPTDN
ncbi:MAG: hypothetical protein HWE24_01365 [Oceanospirillaceae bacterium]|nr:hypothetical protein [Oceanospirillaceae bacterium]